MYTILQISKFSILAEFKTLWDLPLLMTLISTGKKRKYYTDHNGETLK